MSELLIHLHHEATKIEGASAVKLLRPLEAEPESFYASRFNLV
jgi:hypothetical protein